jgi:hypothetical protein
MASQRQRTLQRQQLSVLLGSTHTCRLQRSSHAQSRACGGMAPHEQRRPNAADGDGDERDEGMVALCVRTRVGVRYLLAVERHRLSRLRRSDCRARRQRPRQPSTRRRRAMAPNPQRPRHPGVDRRLLQPQDVVPLPRGPRVALDRETTAPTARAARSAANGEASTRASPATSTSSNTGTCAPTRSGSPTSAPTDSPHFNYEAGTCSTSNCSPSAPTRPP